MPVFLGYVVTCPGATHSLEGRLPWATGSVRADPSWEGKLHLRRHRASLISLIVLSLAVAVPANAINPFKPRVKDGSSVAASKRDHFDTVRRAKIKQDLTPYAGLGTWIDMYDEDPWEDPEGAVLDMSMRGVTTLYLETSNWHKRSDIYKPTKTGRFIDAAHAAGIDVVAWYVPGFKNLNKDKRRTLAALNFVSETGQTFDSFAMDIEATVVKDLARRNARMVKLSRWARDYVGPNYTMAGIVPDVQSLFWAPFPYASVAEYYDLIMPMSYFTYRVEGRKAVKAYIAENFTQIRSATGDPNIPIHNIGGIGGRSTRREARAYANTVISHGGLGGSYYDYPITAQREWDELARLAR